MSAQWIRASVLLASVAVALVAVDSFGGPPRTVEVSAEALMRLAELGAAAIPRAEVVPARGNRPEGVRLDGVSGLSVGLRDGDVVTEVQGQPVRSERDVRNLVFAALGKHETSMSGVFYRGAERCLLKVAVPYPLEADRAYRRALALFPPAP